MMELPHETAHLVEDFMQSGFVNIVGGAAVVQGTPEHIKCIAEKAAKFPTRVPPVPEPFLRLSAGNTDLETNFVNIGERTNITGSPKFSKLILSGNFEALKLSCCSSAGRCGGNRLSM